MEKKKIIRYICLFLLGAILLGFVFVNRSYLGEKRYFAFASVSEMFFGQDGNTLVIDDGGKTLLIIDSDGNISRRWKGGDDGTAFFYATRAAQTPDGSVYVADVVYGERGTLLQKERIIRLNGRKSEIVYEINYEDNPDGETPLQNGRILELQEAEGKIYFTLYDGKTIEVRELGEGDSTLLHSAEVKDKISDASYDITTNALAVCYRTGKVELIDIDAKETKEVSSNPHQIPWDIEARNGQVYYTEPNASSIFSFSQADVSSNHAYMENESILYKLDVAKDGKNLLTTDYGGFYRVSQDSNDPLKGFGDYVEGGNVGYFLFVILIWVFLVLGALIMLFFVVLGIR